MPRALTTTIGVPIPSPADRLDQLPAVEPGQHQVEDADVGALEAQPGETELAPLDRHGVEAGRREMSRHAVGDHFVVLDDQHARHGTYDRSDLRREPVTIW